MAIYNACGSIVREFDKPEPVFILDLSGKGPGVYYLHIEGEKWSVIRKIVILKK
jgi:hypothetical protein